MPERRQLRHGQQPVPAVIRFSVRHDSFWDISPFFRFRFKGSGVEGNIRNPFSGIRFRFSGTGENK
jgi:hypothetical protein